MKLEDIVAKNDAELTEFIKAQKIALRDAVIESRTKEIKNVKTQYGIKRSISRALTSARQREITAIENNMEQTS